VTVGGRAVDDEMAYNPNDCVEQRRAEAQESAEASTCNRHAPAALPEYPSWFRDGAGRALSGRCWFCE
jgi:hypothetical protein